MVKGKLSLLSIFLILILFLFFFAILNRKEDEPIRVVILNASGKKGLNKFFSNYLRNRKVDIIYTADVEKESINTVVVDRYSNRCYYGKKIASILKIKNYVSIIDTNFTEQVIIILGNDVDKLKILKRSVIEKNK